MKLYHGDSRDVLDTLEPDSLHSCVCDPPYALVSIAKRFGGDNAAPAQFGKDGAYARASAGFMNAKWDTGEVAFDPCFWRQVLRVLRPGAYLAAFGGTRSSHRLVCAIEDAGFEVRESIGVATYECGEAPGAGLMAWTYGSGFPKSHNLPGGFGSALKPSHEPICIARKPLSEKNIAANWERWGTGAMNIDAGRIAASDNYTENTVTQGVNTAQTSWAVAGVPKTFAPSELGRWPANAIFLHHPDCEDAACAPECQVAALDRQSGQSVSNGTRDSRGRNHQVFTGEMRQSLRDDVWQGPQDTGGASRFFYCPKPSTAERNAGCGGRAPVRVNDGRTSPIDNAYQRGETQRLNTHPTLKPLALMEYLCKLLTPPGGTILDPFMGSGTTGMAAANAGFGFVGIEKESEYYRIACARLDHAQGKTGLFASEEAA